MPAAQGERPADQPARSLLVGRDRGRHRTCTGRRRARPGCSSSLGQFLFFAGDLYTYSYPKLFGAEVEFPSLGDAIYLAVYPALVAGLLLLVRRRNPQGDRAGVIDSLILTVGIALLSWVFLVAPNIHLSGLTLLEKGVSAAYPLGDILLLAAAIRLAVDNGQARAGLLPPGRQHRLRCSPSTPPTPTRSSPTRTTTS